MDAHGIQFSSANSINIGRLVPQAAYYVYAYVTLLRDGVIKEGESINVAVPTGNFGNILAAYYAKMIGLPVGKLICASNENKVLYDFFVSGTYDKNRPFYVTSSPSMDILVSSNLERLLYHVSGENAEETAARMASLSADGHYSISDGMRKKLADFYGGYATEDEVSAEIRKIYEKDSYVIDPHTAVAAYVCDRYRKATGDDTPVVIASTASPYKFCRSVLHAIDPDRYDKETDLEQFDSMHKVSGTVIPQAIEEIRSAEVRHRTVCTAQEMKQTVKEILGL